ncbi:AraC family transcriptional regulator [Anaerocolumna sp. AGMB13020]|uniref:AraC family transcriptional regulator n=1 Tax=Anaerocolumna sp. AGMB13020 TaxID=3081750 RepID=UPI0029537DFA|nr:AraC family transcriptional regulator [Anaerocolumna sp. AGMB13020]WOO37980.1 AraC family transcriptional regulator [Anaerocolumna sp. AGMB13020]
MSTYFTEGREFYPGYQFPIYHTTENCFSDGTNERDHYKMIFVITGTGILTLNNRKQIIVAPSALCLNETDIFSLESEVSLQCTAVLFHPQIINQHFNFPILKASNNQLSVNEIQDLYWLNPFLSKTNDFMGLIHLGPSNAHRISNILDNIKDALDIQKDNDWPCRSRTYLIEMLFLLSRLLIIDETLESVKLDKDPGEIKEIILYFYTNYMNKITIQELTGKFHINRTSLTERFREITGYPVMEYLIRLRLYLASKMLKETLLPVSEIIERVGFSDLTHFGRMFKKNFGYSPSEYRTIYCTML